jgi:hypothetical protein
MLRIALATFVVVLMTTGCQSDAQMEAAARKDRQRLDQMFPPGTSRTEIIAKHAGRTGRHTDLPTSDLNQALAGEDFIRWCVGDCVVRGDPPVKSLDCYLAGSGVWDSLDAYVVLYDADDRVIRCYRHHLD